VYVDERESGGEKGGRKGVRKGERGSKARVGTRTDCTGEVVADHQHLRLSSVSVFISHQHPPNLVEKEETAKKEGRKTHVQVLVQRVNRIRPRRVRATRQGVRLGKDVEDVGCVLLFVLVSSDEEWGEKRTYTSTGSFDVVIRDGTALRSRCRVLHESCLVEPVPFLVSIGRERGRKVKRRTYRCEC
jgi:hypothetical protein